MCGTSLIILNVFTTSIYDKHGCTDPLLQSTITVNTAGLSYQWMFTFIGCCLLTVISLSLERNRRVNLVKRARSVFNCLLYFKLGNDPEEHAIQSWKRKVARTHGKIPTSRWRVCAFALCHLPFVLLAIIPSFGYVLGQNVPTGSAWYTIVLNSPLVVAIVNGGLEKFCFPRASAWLGTILYGRLDDNIVNPRLVIHLNRSQAGSMLLLKLIVRLMAPILSFAFF